MFVCFTLFVSFWCSPIMSNIIYCCLCDIYLAKSKKRPRHRCVTPTKTSVKQFARGVSLFGWFSYHYFVLFVLQLFVDIVCHTINNICILCQVAFAIWNSIFWLFSDAPSALNNWPDSFKNHPEISHRATDNTATNDLPGNISARFTGGLLVSRVS